jgi:hypothetical protein
MPSPLQRAYFTLGRVYLPESLDSVICIEGYARRIISISWGINAPEDGGLSRLPHIIEKIRSTYAKMLTSHKRRSFREGHPQTEVCPLAT